MSKIKSQRSLAELKVEESVSHWTSGELKSPVIMISVDELFWIVCVKFEIASFMYESHGLGGI